MSRPKLTVNKRLIEVGKRIQLIHAVNNKGGSELREGDEGTIVDIAGCLTVLAEIDRFGLDGKGMMMVVTLQWL
jgi:proteasome assembly chaperone (PAC2) family protein